MGLKEMRNDGYIHGIPHGRKITLQIIYSLRSILIFIDLVHFFEKAGPILFLSMKQEST